MRPTLEAEGLKESLLQYLSTTYALTDEGARKALHRFLGDENSGMFRGPFLRLRTPFVQADPSWTQYLDWCRTDGWTPYAHQAAAFERLSSADGRTPRPTLVTTGTGSGKTEAFLYPVLDHCARERAAGRDGVKAVFLYPMNALATDQAQRINSLLTSHPELQKVRAGLYIGDRAAVRYGRVFTDRSDMQLTPPDILITNYKMLDLLLQRAADAPLWADADIRYVVVDEFHTYDGAQGTDVAMLLRRLASAVGAAEKGRPLGRICPVATSATLASGTDADGERQLLDVATQVFGTTFEPDAIVGEQRLTVDEFVPGDAFAPLPVPLPDELAALPDPTLGAAEFAALAEAVTGDRNTDPHALGRVLSRHPLTAAVLHALDGQVRSLPEVLDLMWRAGAPSWGQTVTLRPEVAAKALTRFVALLSVARDPASGPEHPRPFVQVEVHQWARSVSRLVRGVLPWPKAEFQWDTAGTPETSEDGAVRTAPATTATEGQAANLFLPAVYCRDCGRSGWAVFTPESDDLKVEVDTHKIRRASVSQDKMRVRNLIAATESEAKEGSGAALMDGAGRAAGRADANALSVSGAGQLRVLDGPDRKLRLPDPAADYDRETGSPRLTGSDSAFVLVFLGENATRAAEDDWCPACGSHNTIRYLGTGSAALAAASVTQLFTGGELDARQGETKTLMFNDSVQDAAHRAGFVASRSYTFSLRALFKSHLSEDAPTSLNDLIADVVAATTDRSTLAAVVPTDLHDVKGVKRLLSGEGRGGDRKTWELIGERFAFEALMEFGFRSRNGRTLELTRTAAAQVRIADPSTAVDLVRAAHTAPYGKGGRLPIPDTLDDARYLGFLRIFLERLRTRGAIGHRWLDGYLKEAGTSRYFIWGKRPQGMRAFPKGIAAPVFLLSAPKTRSEFDFATGRLSWYERWAQRSLGLPREQAAEFWSRLLPDLVDAGLLAVRTPEDAGLRIYGLKPGAVDVQLLKDDEVNEAFVRCPSCFWEQTVHPSLLPQWDGQKCPAYRCRTGRLVAGTRPEDLGRHQRDRDYRDDYYRRLYRKAGTYQVITAEHTGMLTRREREQVETAFRHGTGFKDPNVLSCTPTLEMGIDIGDLSAVVLAALPRRAANYAQQVGRAGRRTGNAFLLTIPDRSRRDLYYLDQPREMIAGQIVPPGSHLSAIEILRRQYLAHLLDLAAQGRLLRPDGRPLAAIPHEAPALFGPSGYLADLVEAALGGAPELVEAFLELFPTGVSPKAADDLCAYAARGLRGAVEEAARQWQRGEDELRRRLTFINEAIDELHENDDEQRVRKAELEAERRAVGKRLMKRGLTAAQQALCDLGLLPNYALIDSATTLNATLYWPEGPDPKTGRERFDSKMRSYERPRRYALSELAPGNTFYVNGYKHQITGIEIGSSTRPDWTPWRFCRECGYVRTDNAAEDRSPCPRCHSTGIADDGSALHQVIEPTVVTSRDKRDDARIGDDKDDRERRFYTVVDAVDIPEEHIEPGASWRHTRETFGVDYSRKAVIRKINVGPLRFDARTDDELAGHDVRMAPFHVCTACGAATADGQPVFDRDTDALDSSAVRNPAVKHHQPWCPLRRGKRGPDAPKQEPVLLAHQLTTEALRILLPAATVLVDQKIHSFRAALRLGVDRHFGGDPAHLDTTLATMPDRATGEKRQFLVLYDRLPGGTGYLDRLTRPDAFRAALAEARDVLFACPCKEEGRRACHRCLHRYTEERHQDDVSRGEALEIISGLLGPVDGEGAPVTDHWQVENVPTTAAIGLDRQVESDLEARFLAALRTWSKTQRDASLEESGTHSGRLRFAAATTWRLTAQRDEEFTRTDFTFETVEGTPRKVHVFLDGHRYHATREHNRIAADCRKRDELRAGGALVFQITWDDLELFEAGERAKARPVWPPYRRTGQDTAKDWYEQFGGDRADLAGAVFVNPVDTLLGYLRDPSLARWGRRAAALIGGFMSPPEPLAQNVDRAQAREALRGALHSLAKGESPACGLETGTGDGDVLVLSAVDEHGLQLLYTVDTSGGPKATGGFGWGALAVLDDRADGGLGTAEHKLRWRSWLYWSNLLQFLAFTGGDGVQLATSLATDFAVEVLRVSGGTGELDSLITGLNPETPVTGVVHDAPADGADLPADEAGPEPPSADAAAESSAERALEGLLRDAVWDEEILELLEEDEPDSDLTRLAKRLAAQGKKAPVFGHELGERGWQADFAWPGSGVKIAVVVDSAGHDSEERRKRDAAYTGDGWTLRTAADWLGHFDTLLTLLPDTEGPARR